VMGDSRAKATIVSHHPRSGSPMGKIVPKGDFSHRSRALRGCGLNKPLLLGYY